MKKQGSMDMRASSSRIGSVAGWAVLLAIAACTQNPAPQTTATATASAPTAAAGGAASDAAVTPNAAVPAGRHVAKDGEMCGGIAGIPCADGSYCATEAKQCEVADGAGVCRVKPTACTEQFEPVCGCDAKTYSNACKAAMAGLNVDVTGECQ